MSVKNAIITTSNSILNSILNTTPPNNFSVDNFYVDCMHCNAMVDISVINTHEEECIIEQLKSKYGDPVEPIPEMIECAVCFKLIDINHINEHEPDCIGETNKIKLRNDLDKLINPLQLNAIEFVNEHNRIKFAHVHGTSSERNKLLKYFEEAPVLIHFHPCRLSGFLENDPQYRNQFETGTSSGSKDLESRKTWEDRLFNSIYKDAKPCERVKYGHLNITGAKYSQNAHSYGDSYLILHNDIKKRSTFTIGDSSSTNKTFSFTYANEYLNTLSPDLKQQIISDSPYKTPLPVYVEVQIHGDVKLERDVVGIAVRIKHKSSNIGRQLENICKQHKLSLEWFST